MHCARCKHVSAAYLCSRVFHDSVRYSLKLRCICFSKRCRLRSDLYQNLRAKTIRSARMNNVAQGHEQACANGCHTARTALPLRVCVRTLLVMRRVLLHSNKTVLLPIAPSITEILPILGRALGKNVRTISLAVVIYPCKLHEVSVGCAPIIICLVSMLLLDAPLTCTQNPNAANCSCNRVAHSTTDFALMIPNVLVCAKLPLASIHRVWTMTDYVLTVFQD